ncbi:hypothetical protein Tco_1379470, partial [Tanacetum coccineum]
MVFYQMDTEEVSDRFVAPCFVNGLEAYDGKINLGVEENMISNEYAVKLCLEHEVKRGNKVVKKELIVALRGEIYFVKFIINPEEDDVEPGKPKKNERAKMIGTICLIFNIDDIPLLGEEGLSLFVCKMRKSSRNKKRATENLNFFYQDIGTSSSAEDKVEVDAKIVKEEEEDVKRIKGEALKEQEDPRVFIFPIRLDGIGRMEKKVDRGITMINHTEAEAIGILTNVLCQVGVTTLIAKFLIIDIPIDRDSPIVVGRGFLRTIRAIVNTLKRLFSTFDSGDEVEYQIKRNKFGASIYGPKPAPYLSYNDPDERSLAIQTVTNPFRKISVWKKAVSFLGSLPVPLKQVNWKPDYKGSYTKEEEATGQWRTKIRFTDP